MPTLIYRFLHCSIFPAAALIMLSLLAFANSFPGQFIYDDVGIVRDNPLVIDPDLVRIFQSDYWGEGYDTGAYRPLMILSLAMNRLLFGHAAWGYHLVNVGLHAAITLLSWRVLTLYGFTARVGWLAAAIFAVHPIHTEVINEIVGRSELLAAFFVLLGLVAAKSPLKWRLGLALAAFLAAFLSKEHAITVVAILPLLDAWSVGPIETWRQRRQFYLAIAATILIWLLWRRHQLAGGIPLEIDPIYVGLAYLPDMTRVLTALGLQWLYLGKLFWPVGLQGIYSGPGFPPLITSPWSLTGITVVATWCGAATLCLWGWRKRSPVALCASLYLATFLPASNILFPIGLTFAERLTYFPSLWFCTAVAILLMKIPDTLGWKWLGGGLAATIILAGTGLTLTRNLAFASETALWQTDIDRDPANVLAQVNLATLRQSAGQIEEAEQIYKRMLRSLPTDYPGGWHAYSLYLLRAGRTTEVVDAALTAEKLWRAQNDPRGDYSRALLAHAHVLLGDYLQALAWLDRGAKIIGNPDLYWETRGKALAGLGRHEEAVQAFAKINSWLPDTDTAEWYGLSLLQTGRHDEALRSLKMAIRLRNCAVAWNATGVIHGQQARWPEAIDAFGQAVQLAPTSTYYRDNLQHARQMASPRSTGRKEP